MAKRNADRLVVHAAELATCRGPREGVTGEALARLELVRDGAVAIGGGRILAVGTTERIRDEFDAQRTLDARGRLVTPAFADPHSHLLYGGTRHEEYEAKVTGRTPVRLAGGIRYTVSKTREASDAALTAQALADLDIMLAHGTTLLEAKTGYGLEREQELRLLRLTARLEHAVEVVPTFLPLHVLPEEYKGRRREYLEMALSALPEAAGLARYCDVTCDPIGFTYDECLEVGAAARSLGMKIRVHADQMGEARGAALAARLQASGADHLDYATDEGLAAMAKAGTVATLLPGVTLHLMELEEKPFVKDLAKRAIAAGCVVALSTDYNPGSCPTQSMQMVMQLAARLFRIGYAEIWHMCTLNAARALDCADERGSLEPGKRADLVVWSVPAHGMVINRFGVNLVEAVIANGNIVHSSKEETTWN
jgi:imidazolonepropionase